MSKMKNNSLPKTANDDSRKKTYSVRDSSQRPLPLCDPTFLSIGILLKYKLRTRSLTYLYQVKFHLSWSCAFFNNDEPNYLTKISALFGNSYQYHHQHIIISSTARATLHVLPHDEIKRSDTHN